MKRIEKELKLKILNMRERTELEQAILDLEKIHNKDKNILDKIRLIKSKIDELENRLPNDSHKLYLSEIIDIENPEFTGNDLIISPIGSGKTTYVKKYLENRQFRTNKALLLVSNRFLKESTMKDMSNNNSVVVTFTSENIKKVDEDCISLHLMTYHEFGLRISDNNKFVEDISVIFCDEIHSLPEYKEFEDRKDNDSLAHAIKYLFNKQENKQIFYFTATDENLRRLNKKRPTLLTDITVHDYRKHPDIKRYMELSKFYITHIEQIRPFLRSRIESFNYFEHKGLAFARTISSQKRMEQILIEEGYKPLVIWSDINTEHLMNESQLEGREKLLSTGLIPEEYNFLITNSALREGWNLKDPAIKLAIMNTTNETDIIQARGRIRKDIDIIIYKTTKDIEKFNDESVLDKYIEKPLSSEDKDELCKELNVRGTGGNLKKWPTIKNILKKNGYKVEDVRRMEKGIRKHYSIISIEKVEI